MNWYKRAYPVIFERPEREYNAFGHGVSFNDIEPEQAQEYLWVIDEAWNFDILPSLKPNETHGNIQEWGINETFGNYIAKGRAWINPATNQKEVSLLMSPMVTEKRGKLSIPQMRVIVNKVEDILDKQFGYPKIHYMVVKYEPRYSTITGRPIESTINP